MNTRMSIKAQVIENAKTYAAIFDRKGLKGSFRLRAARTAHSFLRREHPEFIKYQAEWFEAVK